MGVGRLLAKGWILFCAYALALAVHKAAAASQMGQAPSMVVAVLLFMAMGVLFAGGYGVSARDGETPFLARLRPHHLMPDFNGIVFLIFIALSFLNQILFAPFHLNGTAVGAIQRAIQFAVPGQDGLLVALSPCAVDGGQAFSSAFAWILAIVFVASALSRVRLAAGLLRLERTTRPEVLGAGVHAAVLGLAALAAIQLLFIGSAYRWIDCHALIALPGAVLIGMGPLMLAYLIVAAITALLATGAEQ
jgi:hypothetical protein